MTTVSSFSSLSPPLPCRPITQKKGSTIPTSTAAVLPIQTRWVWEAAAAKTIIQPGIPKCFNQPFNNVLARVFSPFWLDGWGQLGWTMLFQKSPPCCSMDCFLLFYTKHIPHKLPMVSSLQLVLFLGWWSESLFTILQALSAFGLYIYTLCLVTEVPSTRSGVHLLVELVCDFD